jgi:spore germination protein GerM
MGAVGRCGVIMVALLVSGCGEGTEGPEPGAEAPDRDRIEGPRASPPDSVTLVFTRNEAASPVRRPVPHGALDAAAALERALSLLVSGPTPEERDQGLHSWFSSETAAVLLSAEVDPDGHAVVDFRDLRPLIPGASSSAGSEALLRELNGTVFQFPGVRSVEYRIEGSCALFWEWLQYDCQRVDRPGG